MKKISLLLELIMLFSCVMFACETEMNDNKNDNESSINSEQTSSEETSSKETSSKVEKSESYKEAVALIEQSKYEEAYTLLYSVHKTDKDCADLIKDFKVVYVSHTAKGEGICGDYDYIQTSVYTYDSMGNLLQKVYSLDSVYADEIVTEISTTVYTYNEGKLIKEEQPDSNGIPYVAEYFYDTNGVLTKKIGNSNGVVSTTEYSYDSNGRISKEVYNITVGEKYSRTESKEYVYDTDGRLLKITEKKESGDIVTEYTYNSHGKILKEVCNYYYGAETVTDYVYDADGKLLKKLCPNGDYVSVEYTYDSNGNIIKEISVDAEGITETIEYTGYLYFYCPQE